MHDVSDIALPGPSEGVSDSRREAMTAGQPPRFYTIQKNDIERKLAHMIHT